MLNWLISVLRTISFWVDSIIYPLIGKVYNLFIDIANTTIFTEDLIDVIASKVYALLGIFMLFKVSFSILTYIVNPDDFIDKSKGFSKLISNIIITLTLLVTTPWIFSQAMDIQKIILHDNVIPKLLSTYGSEDFSIANAGDKMSFETFKAFYYVDVEEGGFPECGYLYGKKDESGNDLGSEAACGAKIGNDHLTSITRAENTQLINFYLTFDLVNLQVDNKFVMSYMPIISFLCGGLIGWIFISFCFDIAVRSVKLGFLRIIAPIPIVSRIDPKKGKGVFDRWFKACMETYLDLFIRLIAINFSIFLITQVISNLAFVDAATGESKSSNPLVVVFIIIGALLFAKQLPKLIEDITGLKLDGKFSLSPGKRLQEVPLVGKGMSALASGVDSAVHHKGFANGFKRGWNDVPLGGGDGKKSVFDTNERKIRKDLTAKRIDGSEREKLLKHQKDSGQSPSEKVKENEIAKRPRYEGIFEHKEFAKSKMAVDEAKKVKYEWENYANKTYADYQETVAKYGAGSAQAQTAFEHYEDAKKNAGIASSRFDYVNKLHESVRQQYYKDAAIEDAMEAYDKVGNGPMQRPSEKYKSSPTPAPSPAPASTPTPGSGSNSSNGSGSPSAYNQRFGSNSPSSQTSGQQSGQQSGSSSKPAPEPDANNGYGRF